MTTILIFLFVLVVGGLLWDAWSYKRNIRRVRDLLQRQGPMTGLELSQAGVSRAHVYLILSRLEEGGEVKSQLAPDPKYEGQKIYRVNWSTESHE